MTGASEPSVDSRPVGMSAKCHGCGDSLAECQERLKAMDYLCCPACYHGTVPPPPRYGHQINVFTGELLHVERIAARFHETYERLAQEHGYETRPDSAVPWRQVPEKNRRLMMATVRTLLEQGDIRP